MGDAAATAVLGNNVAALVAAERLAYSGHYVIRWWRPVRSGTTDRRRLSG
jgi:hypothetical protein